jgi:serine/threonine protein kinase
MSEIASSSLQTLNQEQLRHIEEVCDRFEAAWKTTGAAPARPSIEDCLGETPEPVRSALLRELVALEVSYRRRSGEAPQPEEYCKRFHDELDLTWIAHLLAQEETGLPIRFGRYRVQALLGSGTFGDVYRGEDGLLQRLVAIKVPRRNRVRSSEEQDAFLEEARVLACLDHEGIVRVYDYGKTDDGLCYVVSQFIDGTNLQARIEQEQLPFPESLRVVASVARALYHAHQEEIIHRDIKPANILLNREDRPYLADFGIALKQEHAGTRLGIAGTPAYMSPEQVRGDTNWVSPRSDIYSLGVVLYQLLTDELPFKGKCWEAAQQKLKLPPPSPRQRDPMIPDQVAEICVKCLATDPSSRYSTAIELAEKLERCQFHDEPEIPEKPIAQVHKDPSPPSPPSDSSSATGHPPVSTSAPPKQTADFPGLRSWQAKDHDYFLDLLPEPSRALLAFLKSAIEALDPAEAFAVGLLSGESGCGKSSLVKAGLLPSLAAHVIPVYVKPRQRISRRDF